MSILRAAHATPSCETTMKQNWLRYIDARLRTFDIRFRGFKADFNTNVNTNTLNLNVIILQTKIK